MKKKFLICIMICIILIIIIGTLAVNETILKFLNVELKNLISTTQDAIEYDVTEFGANGEDEKSDREAIQTALNKANTTDKDIIVYVPEGTYYIDKMLNIYSNTTLRLDKNAVIVSSTGKITMLKASHLNDNGSICADKNCTHGGYTQWENVTIEGGTWNFNNDGNVNYNGIYTPHGQNIIIRNATFMNSAGHTLNVSGSQNVFIENVTIKNQVSCEPKKADNTNESIHLDTATVDGEPAAFPCDNTPNKNVTIQNCTFENILCGIGAHLGYNGYESYMGDNIVIRNNTFKDVKCYAIDIFAHKNVEIYGNTATGKNINNVLSQTEEAYGFVQTSYTDAKIHDNTVNNFEYTVVKGINDSKYTITCDDEKICNKFFIVEYKANSGTGTMESDIIEYGVATKLSKNGFKKYGYKFVGWNAHRTYPGNLTWICTNNKWYTEEEIEENGYTKLVLVDQRKVSTAGAWHHSTVEMYAQWIERNKIEISEQPTKLTYIKNIEELDLSDGVIKSTYEDGSDDTISLADENIHVTGFDNSKLGTQTLTVDYEGKQTTFEVEIKNDITGISVKKSPSKTTYIKGENLELTGGMLTVRYENGETADVPMTSNDVGVTGYNSENVGEKTITLTYNGKQATFKVNVKNDITGISVKTAPSKTTYIKGENLELTGGMLTATYENGETADVPMTSNDVGVTGYNSENVGEETITLTYNGKQATFKVNVKNEITGISVKTAPSKTTYIKGENLELTGGMLTATYENGETADVPMTSKNIGVTGYNSENVGEQTIILTYNGKTTEFNVKVIENSNKVPNTGVKTYFLESLIIAGVSYALYMMYKKTVLKAK